MGAEGPARLLEPLDDRLDGLDLRLTVGVKGGAAGIVGGDVDVVLGTVAQDALVAGEGEDGLGPVEGEVGVLQHELVQDRGSVQILGEEGLAGVGIGALGPDLAVVSQHQLGGEALSQHVVVIVYIIKGDNEGLFSLGEHEGVPLHAGDAVLAGDFTPHVPHVDQNVALVVDALKDLFVLVRGHHPLVQPHLAVVGHCVGKGILRIGDDGVEKQVLHRLVGAPGLGELVLAPVGAHRVVGIGRGGGGGLRCGRGYRGSVRGRLVGFVPAAGGQGERQGAGQRQGNGFWHDMAHWYGSSHIISL